ncbi:UHRF1-binding protein 1-like protein [Ooceraea biroi]|uniref:UHRF1-binding protein 1-like protein n=1 Tax=Ooceraea biroi TaxID=2015173 RepID=A0A026WH53_OOCBI|nr:UHRF1-binding protein 1-like protein [Ooceraea biroi]
MHVLTYPSYTYCRFTKNLSADKINLSTFKGEGELTNLELDEIVLTDLLELPSWLRLTNAWCNKVSFRIQWTKLKSVPIFLSLDEVHIDVETCEDLRSTSSPQGISSYTGPAKYSFIHKVIDGITVAVNTVLVTFKSPAFIASVQMNRIMVESKSATWQRCDLRTTRVKDPDRGQLLIFKELEWQTVRIEAQSTKDKNLTPLRLLTNQARCRITIKKRISDCFVMGSRLVIILDDLLWVLTDSQLKAALHFLDSLGGLIEKATVLERKTKAARKLEVLPEYQAQISQQSRTKSQVNTAISKIFTRYDVVETSYHFLSQRIDLHLCDDAGGGRSLHPELKDGGALQISLVKFQIDYYPYHLAMADRKHWAKYKENATPHSQWLQQSLSTFRSQFMDLIDSGRTQQHSPLTRSQGTVTKKSQHPSGNPVKNYVLEQLAKLMTTCIIIRIDDFTLYKVTTTSRNPLPKEFITAQTRKKHMPGDRDRFSLPEDVTILHAEFTYYYYPGDITFPLPPPKFYVQLNPIQLNFDVCSCLWFNSFALNLYHSLIGKNKQLSSSRLMYFDVKIEAILPRIVFESQQDYPNQKDRPKSLHLQTSRASITNVRSMERSSRADLAQCLNAFQMGQMFFGAEFPSKSGDFHVVTDKFLAHCGGTDNIRQIPSNFSSNSVNELLKQLNRELLWTEAKDVWCCNLEPVWGDFFGARAVGQNRSVPFLDAFPLTLWCHFVTEPSAAGKSASADIHGLAYIGNLVSVQINHYQKLVTESKHSKSDSGSNTPFIPNNFNVNLSSMKKGFSNLMTSIDSALKASPEDGSSDTVSMRSDVSSDSENYVLVNLQDQGKIDAVFGIDSTIRITAVEEATEVVEETPDTQSEKSMDSVCKRKDIVSMATFKLSKVEFIQQSSGYSSVIKVQVSNIDNDECSSIPWDEFQTKFSSRSRGWVELPSDSDCRSRIKLRLDHVLKNPEDSRKLWDAKSVMNLFEDKLEIKVANVAMALSMSSVTGLADLAEDEIIPKPIPVQIYVENISLRLNEDRPPNNITSPGPIPIDLNISKLRIARDLNGVFHIEPIVNATGESSNTALPGDNSHAFKNPECERELNALRQSSKQLKLDNEELRRRMGALERLSEENARLMRAKEESDMIRSRLSAAEDDITSLLEEKRILHETIMELRNQRLESGPGGSNRASWSIKR